MRSSSAISEEDRDELRPGTWHSGQAIEQEDQILDEAKRLREIEAQAYREASERCMRVMNASLAHIGSRLLTPKGTMRDVLTDYFAVCIAHGSFICGDMSISQIAHRIGVSRATLSALAVQFCVGQDLPPSFLMRDPETMKAYREARLKVVGASK